MTRRRWVALVVAIGTISAACTDVDDTSNDSTVTVFGPYVGNDADRFAGVIADFESATGIDVAYTGSIDFVSDLRQRLIGNQRPDVALVPQPGVVDDLIDESVIVPLAPGPFQAVRDAFDEDDLADLPWNPRFVVPYRSNTKSLVWYRPAVFTDNGWAVPQTLGELDRLATEIEEAGDIVPWCFSIFAGSATGWPATDWIEDLVLRREGTDVYERFAAGELSWQSEAVREAFGEFRDLVLDDARVVGGTRGILQTEVPNASAPLFDDPPGCAMYKQASFAEDWFPAGTEIGPGGDVDFFVLPGVSAADTLLVAGGDGAVGFDDRPDVNAFLAFLASADGGRAWATDGGFVSERVDVDIDDYYVDTDGLVAELLRSDAVTRFDASDTLPAEIGSGLLWELITLWVEGSVTLDGLLATMDEQLGIVD
jgi:alpha-glucoside transport system substrate-binding protein